MLDRLHNNPTNALLSMNLYKKGHTTGGLGDFDPYVKKI